MRLQRFAPVLVLLLAAPAFAGVEAEVQEGGARYKVTFKHSPVIAAQSVSVAGSWNGWDKAKNPLKESSGGVWSATLELPRGRHTYKFVINGSVWQHDGDNSKSEPDGMSGLNSVLELGSGTPPAAGKEGDGAVSVAELSHDPQSLADACAVDGNRRLVLRMRTLASDAARVLVDATPRPEATQDPADEQGLVPMRRVVRTGGLDTWEVRVLFAKGTTNVRYQFVVEDAATRVGFGPKGGFTNGRAKKAGHFTLGLATAGRFETPEWARDAVFYQIFPDRFANGDPSNDPKKPRRPEGKAWHIDDAFLEDWSAEPAHFNFFGGDLKGIEAKLDYIASLGVNALYLNPIFEARSNHKYDAADYEKVDPAFGTQKEWEQLCASAEKRGIRVILDAVFNHTGDGHYMFQDCVKNGPKSKYWQWYFFDGATEVKQKPKPNYRCWWGFGSLPQLNTKKPEVIAHLMKVGEKWLKDGAAGWRLDVPNEVEALNPDFWPEFRRRVRKARPDAYIVGEIWTDARAYLQGDRFDAVMNYPFRSAALEFIAKANIDATKFDELLGQQRATYPEPALRVQFNLLGSHDTERLLTVASGDARRARLCKVFQFAYLGPPVVYYGDEVGVSGGKDPECRRTFPWDEAKQDAATQGLVKALGKVRGQEPVLRRGTVRTLHAERKTYAFIREPEAGETGRPVVCVLNSGEVGSTVELRLKGTKAHDLLEPGKTFPIEGGVLRLEVPEVAGMLLAVE